MPFELAPLSEATPAIAPGSPTEPRPRSWPADLPHVPNFSDLQPGDLVLVRSDGSAMCRLIEGVQGSVLSSSAPLGDPAWTHVGLYAGDGLMIEAAHRAGVRYAPVGHYLVHRALRVRRYADAAGTIGPDAGERVARAAAGLFDQPYSYGSIARLLFFQPGVAHRSAFFCSTFVGVAYTLGLQVVLDRRVAHRLLLPGTLVSHPGFVDVALEWRAAR